MRLATGLDEEVACKGGCMLSVLFLVFSFFFVLRGGDMR